MINKYINIGVTLHLKAKYIDYVSTDCGNVEEYSIKGKEP